MKNLKLYQYFLLLIILIQTESIFATVNSNLFYNNSCPKIIKKCPSPEEIMSEPSLARTIHFEEGFECHMNRFLSDVNKKALLKTNIPPHLESCDKDSFYQQTLIDFSNKMNNFISDYTQKSPQVLIAQPQPTIDPICFYGGSLRGKGSFNKNKSFYSCADYNSVSPKKGHDKKGACLSQGYSTKLALTFDHITSCLNFCDQDKHEFFKILNHESSFAPNAKSPSNARCMGQLTEDTMKELQTNLALKILHPNSSFSNNYAGFDFQKDGSCDYLDQYTIPPNFRENVIAKLGENPGYNTREKTLKTYKKNARSGKSNFYYECKILSNPVQCLLYSALNHKKNMNSYMNAFDYEEKSSGKQSFKDATIKERKKFLNAANSKSKNTDEGFSPSYINSNQIGLAPSELYVSHNGVSAKMFQTTGGAYTEFVKHKNPSSSSIGIGKVNIFNEKDMDQLRALTIEISYNAGNSIARVIAKDFISDLRNYIANPKSAKGSKRLQYLEYREAILRGETIDFEKIKKEFVNYLAQRVSKNRKRQNEIIGYHKGLKKDMDYILGQGEINAALSKEHFSDYTGITNKDIAEDFLEKKQSKCSIINEPLTSCQKKLF